MVSAVRKNRGEEGKKEKKKKERRKKDLNQPVKEGNNVSVRSGNLNLLKVSTASIYNPSLCVDRIILSLPSLFNPWCPIRTVQVWGGKGAWLTGVWLDQNCYDVGEAFLLPSLPVENYKRVDIFLNQLSFAQFLQQGVAEFLNFQQECKSWAS